MACAAVLLINEHVNAFTATAEQRSRARWVAVSALADSLNTVRRPFRADGAAVIAVVWVIAEIDAYAIATFQRPLANGVAGLAARAVFTALVIGAFDAATAAVLVVGAEVMADAIPAVRKCRTLHTARPARVQAVVQVPAVFPAAGLSGAARIARVLTFRCAQADTHRLPTGEDAAGPGADDTRLIPLLVRLDELRTGEMAGQQAKIVKRHRRMRRHLVAPVDTAITARGCTRLHLAHAQFRLREWDARLGDLDLATLANIRRERECAIGVADDRKWAGEWAGCLVEVEIGAAGGFVDFPI